MRILEHSPGRLGLDGLPGEGTAAGLGGTKADRWIGMWSARALFAIGVAYAVTMVAGFAAMGDLSKPLEDPYLAVMEVLILVMAPILVLLAVVIHACAPEGTKTYSMTALGWTLLVAGFTMTMHLVQLTVVRRIDPSAIHGFQYLFNWHWPSVLYGVDIVAWDIFFGLALLFAAPVFHAAGRVAVRNGLLIAGVMCVVGVIRPSRQSHCPPPNRDHRLRDRLADRLCPAQQGISARRTALRCDRASLASRAGDGQEWVALWPIPLREGIVAAAVGPECG
jgi:hypothetical protein